MYLRYIALGLSRYKEHSLLSSGHCRIAKDFNRRATLLDVNPKPGLGTVLPERSTVPIIPQERPTTSCPITTISRHGNTPVMGLGLRPRCTEPNTPVLPASTHANS